jgi:hypothetical protein
VSVDKKKKNDLFRLKLHSNLMSHSFYHCFKESVFAPPGICVALLIYAVHEVLLTSG